MKELLHLDHVVAHPPGLPMLNDYNLSIFSGEIVVLHGPVGCGKESVIALLEGSTMPTSGRVFFCGKRLNTPADFDSMKCRVFVLGAEDRIVKSFSVIENLTAVCSRRRYFAFYNKRRAYDEIRDVLSTLGLSISLDTKLENLTYWERQKLDFAKACVSDAKLIIINSATMDFNHSDLPELIELIYKLRLQGISFLIISEKQTSLTAIADRYQLLHQGIDLREWRKDHPFTPEQQKLLVNPQYFLSKTSHTCNNEQIICLYDDSWGKDMFLQCRSILGQMFVDSPQIAQQFFPFFAEGRSLSSSDVICVPRNSHALLMENLSIADNLTICIPQRICSYGLIRNQRVHLLFREFCKMLRLPEDIASIDRLDLAEKKILSIHRWILTHPKAMILEDPFSEFDSEGTHKLATYLQHISSIVPRIIVLERTLYGKNRLYDVIIKTSHGQNAVIDPNFSA